MFYYCCLIEISSKHHVKVKNNQVTAVTFSLAKHFQDHMVLQKAPARANIYGFSPDIGTLVHVQVSTVNNDFLHNYLQVRL